MSEDESLQKYRAQGNRYFRNNDFPEAIHNYKKGLKIDNKNPHLNSNIAQAYLAIYDFENAEIHARVAIRHCQDSAKGYFRAAKASAGQGNKAKAIKYLKDGIVKCKDAKDLEEYHEKLVGEESSQHMGSRNDDEIAEDIPDLVSDSDSDDAGAFAEKLRSRSTSRMASTSSIDSNKSAATSPRSVSMSRTSPVHKTSRKSKKKKGPIEREDIMNDPTLSLFENIQKEKGIPRLQPEQIWATKRKELNILLKEGSEVMASGLSRKAVEKYKTALDTILEHSLEIFKLKEIDVIVLKYALCIGWIELADYGDIAKAVEYLMDIEDTRASKFPAVFYGLGSAYYKLNRYKVATEHLEKGLLFLSREVKFEVQSWPGTNNVIVETTRSGLEDVLKELLKTCRTYHEPDAICRYSKCLSLSSHIIPSEHIFFSDPDFCGFVVVICEEKCKIEYHLGCWKDYKETSTSDEIGKLSEKDFIGRFCPTTDCINQLNERSVIVKIEIVGDDTTIKASIEAPKTESKETKKSKKKKLEKISDVPQEKPKAKNRPKVKKAIPDTVQPSPQPEIQTSNSAEELETRIKKLSELRKVGFGFSDDKWNPSEVFYGRTDIQELDDFLSPEYVGESNEIRAKKDFIYSYFYEFIKSEGPQKVKDVERKWANESGDFQGISELLNNTNSSICMFLLQSYRFASIDDYICLAAQLPDTYDVAKTELVEALCFTLTGHTSTVISSSTDSEAINNVTAKDDKSNQNEAVNSVEENPANNQETPDLNIPQTSASALTENKEHSQEDIKIQSEDKDEDDNDIDIDDPDIDTSEDQTIKTVLENKIIKSGTEDQTVETISDEQGVSEDQDIKTYSENKTISESEDEDIKSESEDEGIKSESKENLNSDSEDNSIKSKSPDISVSESVIISEEEKIDALYDSEGEDNDDNDNASVEDEEEKLDEINKNSSPNKELNDLNSDASDLVSDLNPRAGEFKSPKEEIVENETKTETEKTDVTEKVDEKISEDKDVKKIDPEVSTISVLPKEKSSPLVMDFKEQKWSLNDGQFHSPPLHILSAYQHRHVTHPQAVVPYLGQYMPPLVAPPFAVQRSPESSNVTTQTDRNFDEEINYLKSTISKQEQDLKEEKEKSEAAKTAANTELEEKNKKIEELELELNKVKETKDDEISFLNKKFKAYEVRFKIEKTKLMEELEKAKSENNTNELIRDVISTSGQKVKELEDQITQYQQFILKMIKENTESQINMYKKKCFETLEALERGVKYQSDFSSPNKTEVANNIQKWEKYLHALIESEAKFKFDFMSLSNKSGDITYQDISNKLWSELPTEPDCPLILIEQIACKILEERGDMPLGSTTTLEKEINKLNIQKPLNDLSASKTDRPDTPNNATENIPMQNKTSQNMNVLNKENIKVEDNIVDLDARDKNQHKTMDLPGLQNGQTKTAFNTAGAPLFQHPFATTNTPFSYMASSSPYFFNSQQYYTPTPLQYGQQISSVIMQPNQQPVRSSVSPVGTVRPSFISNENSVLQMKEITSPNVTESKSIIDFSKSTITTTSTSPEQSSQWANDAVFPAEKDSVNRLLLEKKKSPTSAIGLTPIEIKKPVSVTVGSNPVQQTKSFPTVASSSATVTTATKQNSKPIVQVSAPIIAASLFEQKPSVTTAVKQKAGSSYQKLMAQLHKNFPTKTEEELAACISIVREKNNNSLTGISVPKIITMIDKELKDKASKKQGSMGLDKFGGAAWGGVRESALNWCKPKDSTEDDCVICYEPLDKDQTTLQCKHSFHTKCIRKWLRNDSICPMCRVFTRLVDEFPPL